MNLCLRLSFPLKLVGMDLISPSQFQNYETILNEINSEFQKTEELKKEIQHQDDRIITLKLIRKAKLKISHVTAKIFNNIFEIYYLYNSEINKSDLAKLSKLENCKYCLVTIFLTQSLLQKLLTCKWRLQINMSCTGFCSSKIVPLSNKIPFLEILPVNSDVRELTVETCLFIPSPNGWNVIDLDSTKVDASYHFHSLENENLPNLNAQLLNISNLYSCDIGLDSFYRQNKMDSTFQCSLQKHDFFSTVMQNSYHNLDLDYFSKFMMDPEEALEVNFYHDNNRVFISYNLSTKMFRIKCCAPDMVPLLRYFFKLCNIDAEKLEKRLMDSIQKGKSLETASEGDLKVFVENLRKLWI